MKICWANRGLTWGIALGYSTHSRMLADAVERSGTEFVGPDEADVVVHLTTPPHFTPVRGKFNALYTMYEMSTLPRTWVPQIRRADLLLVPCRHNARVFAGYYGGPIEVVQEGVDPGMVPYAERTMPAMTPEDPFVFLWVGASNPRKGTNIVITAWAIWNARHPELRDKTLLVMKSTQSGDVQAPLQFKLLGEGWHADVPVKWPAERLLRVAGNAVVDTRRLPATPEPGSRLVPPASLREQYERAHCFVLPSMGEGWGLTLCEAAASGLPCIYTRFSGPVDFMPRGAGYPVKFTMGTIAAVRPKDDGTMQEVHRGLVAMPDPDDVVRKMEQVLAGYDEALRRGREASRHIHARFTWDRAAALLLEVLERRWREHRDGHEHAELGAPAGAPARAAG